MIYLDNAATSRFKPKCALDALLFDVSHSANSGKRAQYRIMLVGACHNLFAAVYEPENSKIECFRTVFREYEGIFFSRAEH